ncbi:hypothetical protein ColKHC_14321 [Colletotrichum higginsianum]|nr:hypothetical protein ColKHC_14321 [Colletotrichum higginsianum]
MLKHRTGTALRMLWTAGLAKEDASPMA